MAVTSVVYHLNLEWFILAQLEVAVTFIIQVEAEKQWAGVHRGAKCEVSGPRGGQTKSD